MSGQKVFRYFDLPGRGEHIRLALAVAGEQYVFEKVEFKDWGQLKMDVEKCPLGFLPMMRLENGEWLSQSCAILRYLGDEHGMHGDSSMETHKIDMIVSTAAGFVPAFGPMIYGFVKPEDPAAYIADGLKKIEREVDYMQKCLMENCDGKSFMVGDKLSIADCMMISALDMMVNHVPGFVARYPQLVSYNARMRNIPAVKKYYAERNHSMYPNPKTKYTMTYFPVAGRGEQIMLAIAVTGAEATWEAVSFQEWGALKSDVEKCPLGFMPMLRVDATGEMLYQSLDILRYLGNAHDLYGNNLMDRSKIDMILDTQDDWKTQFVPSMDKCARGLDYCQKILLENNAVHGCIVGCTLSIADCAMISSIDMFVTKQPEFAPAYPKLVEYYERMKKIPQIAKYFAERQYTDPPINADNI